MPAIGGLLALLSLGLAFQCNGCFNDRRWHSLEAEPIDCKVPPDKDDDPEAFARWKGRCEERDRRVMPSLTLDVRKS